MGGIALSHSLARINTDSPQLRESLCFSRPRTAHYMLVPPNTAEMKCPAWRKAATIAAAVQYYYSGGPARVANPPTRVQPGTKAAADQKMWSTNPPTHRYILVASIQRRRGWLRRHR